MPKATNFWLQELQQTRICTIRMSSYDKSSSIHKTGEQCPFPFEREAISNQKAKSIHSTASTEGVSLSTLNTTQEIKVLSQ